MSQSQQTTTIWYALGQYSIEQVFMAIYDTHLHCLIIIWWIIATMISKNMYDCKQIAWTFSWITSYNKSYLDKKKKK